MLKELNKREKSSWKQHTVSTRFVYRAKTKPLFKHRLISQVMARGWKAQCRRHLLGQDVVGEDLNII
jgi:hypothetical protein